jgi:hypothetical protein
MERDMKYLLPLLCVAAGAVQAGQTESLWSNSAYAELNSLATTVAQSTDASHPGSNVYNYSSFTITDFKTTDGKSVRIWVPTGATGKLPMLAFGAGKSLGNPVNYQAMFEHLAKKGMVVANIQFEGSFFDTDFVKFAGWFNNAVKQTLVKAPLADPAQVYYAGHSLGSQVSVIAAARATTGDTTNQFVDPKGMILMSYDNSRGPNNAGDLNNPAAGYAVKVAPSVQSVILEFADDTIAGPSKNYAQALYNKLPSSKKQWVRVKGSAFGTAYGLSADHNSPLTAGGAPLNIGGKAVLNTLDWNMVWKMTGGLPLQASRPAYATWLTGAGLLNGGTGSDGVVLQHTLMGQSF